MSSSPRMLRAGTYFVVGTPILILLAIIFSPIWEKLGGWVFASEPGPIDTGLVAIVPTLFYGMILLVWFGLLVGLLYEVIRREDYVYGQ
jgi:hypothetical protein